MAEISGDWTGKPDTLWMSVNGNKDNDNCPLAGTENDCWISDSTHYVKVYTTGAARHNGIYGDKPSAYRLEPAKSGMHGVWLESDYVHIDGLQIKPPADTYGIKAPSGHNPRHQNLVNNRFDARINRKNRQKEKTVL